MANMTQGVNQILPLGGSKGLFVEDNRFLLAVRRSPVNESVNEILYLAYQMDNGLNK